MPVFYACLLAACRLRNLKMPAFLAFLPTSTLRSAEMPAFPASCAPAYSRTPGMPAFTALLPASVLGRAEMPALSVCQPACLPSRGSEMPAFQTYPPARPGGTEMPVF